MATKFTTVCDACGEDPAAYKPCAGHYLIMYATARRQSDGSLQPSEFISPVPESVHFCGLECLTNRLADRLHRKVVA